MTKAQIETFVELRQQIKQRAEEVFEDYFNIYDKIQLEFDPQYNSYRPPHDFDHIDDNEIWYVGYSYFRGNTETHQECLPLSYLYDYDGPKIAAELRQELQDARKRKEMEAENSRLRTQLKELETLARLKEKYESK